MVPKLPASAIFTSTLIETCSPSRAAKLAVGDWIE
jgi:hypothetical protein